MRTFLLFALLTLVSGAAHAQDTLTKRNGDELLVKVLEITPAGVKYRRADNPEGPIISVWRSDVFMIRYANGTKEVFNAVSIYGPARPPAQAGAPAPTKSSGVPSLSTVSNADPNDAILDESIHLDGLLVGFNARHR